MLAIGEKKRWSHEPKHALQMTLDVRTVTSMLGFFRACADQCHVSASNLDGFADELVAAAADNFGGVDVLVNTKPHTLHTRRTFMHTDPHLRLPCTRDGRRR